jgi:hypothetical protein
MIDSLNNGSHERLPFLCWHVSRVEHRLEIATAAVIAVGEWCHE